MRNTKVTERYHLHPLNTAYVFVASVDLVVTRSPDEEAPVLYGR